MDMLTVDLTSLPGVGIGSTVELWGARVPVASVARASGRSAYELLCSVKRAPLVHSNAGQSIFPFGVPHGEIEVATAAAPTNCH